MNKGELVDSIYEDLDRAVTKKDVTAVLNVFFDTVQDTVTEGNKVTIVGFGSFERRERAARQGRNPRSGEVMDIPAVSVPAFSAGKGFKDAVAGK